MASKKLNIWLPLLLAVIMIVGMMLGYRLREKTNRPENIFSKRKSGAVQEVMDLINLKYVDAINSDTITDEAIDEMLSQLDPHSVYIPAVTVDDVNEDLQGNFQGIGVEFNIFNDTVHVVSVLENGPSDKAGLLVGDRFLKVNDSAVAGVNITNAGIKNLLRGPGSSKVIVTMLRNGVPKQFTIQRGVIPVPSVDAGYLINPATGYIHINKFSINTYEEFMKTLEDLQKKGMQSLLLDLRDNGGGILQEAVDIADEFLDGNKLIVYTEGAHQQRQNYRCKRQGLFENGPLVLLVDEGSASASEVLAGALQDWDRATIVGRRTFGKGLVQEQYDLSNGAALRLTVARYFTPLGRSIQKPYEKGNGEEAYQQEVINRFHNGSMAVADSNHIKNGKVYKTQSGKMVYGGGGIMPDVFVSIDTAVINTAFSKLYAGNTLSNYAYRYFIENRATINSSGSPTNLYQQLRTNPSFWNSFTAFVAKDSINMAAFTKKDKDFATKRIVALIARQQWRSNGLYEVLNAEDETVKKALEQIAAVK